MNKLLQALEKIARQQIPTSYDGLEWQLKTTVSLAQQALQEHAANNEILSGKWEEDDLLKDWIASPIPTPPKQ
jgi:hypothetical protein